VATSLALSNYLCSKTMDYFYNFSMFSISLIEILEISFYLNLSTFSLVVKGASITGALDSIPLALRT
jgi:hypothetical protein